MALSEQQLRTPPASQNEPGITLIIPIYNAYACLPQLMSSVRALCPAPDQVILVEDASTDARVRPWLTDYIRQQQCDWTILLQPHNRGFVHSVNQAMRSTHDHCLLLNQDTICEHRLLAKLRTALQRVTNVATITPFSNNAEIVSIPHMCRNNPLPEAIELMATACDLAGEPDYPELPTAVGFCMLITRAAIQAIGYFDAQRYGHGYGEENDFSSAARALGMRNLLCDNAFVAHIGNQSFADLNMQPNREALDKVLARYPDYLQRVQQFIADDPLRDRRDAIINHYQKMLAGKS
jgi:GT2 family glycosyltransferase